MTSAFISYSAKDRDAAKQLQRLTTMAGIDTFLAETSIDPGKKWSDEIFAKLESAQWVFFLATKHSCSSPAVQQELGASLIQRKTIIPLLLGISADELPGWVSAHQAIDLAKAPELLQAKVQQISSALKIDKFWAGVLAGLLVALVVYLAAKS